MAKIEAEPIQIRIRPTVPGYELHWCQRQPGESLQGWYHTLDEAEDAIRQLVAMKLAIPEPLGRF